MNNNIFVNHTYFPKMKTRLVLFLSVCGMIFTLFTFCSRSVKSEKEPEQRSNIPGYYSEGLAGKWDSADWKEFHEQAVEESMLPIRQGSPGKTPFWNGNAKRFIHVPSFDFNRVRNSVKYRYSVISDANGACYNFEVDHPWSLLTPVWNEVPAGIVYLKVEGLDKENNVTGMAGERIFYKAAVFNGPYNLPVTDYRSSVIRNMRSLLEQDHYSRWKTDTIPSDEYQLYCYPSKIVGSIIQAMSIYAGLVEEDRDEAIAMACNAASYLLNISLPQGSVLEFFPPTYLDRTNSRGIARERKDQLMMFYPAMGDKKADDY